MFHHGNVRSLYPVGFFTLAYLLLAAGAAFRFQNWEFVAYIAVILFIAYITVRVHFRVGLTSWTLWALSFWGLIHMVGGLVTLPAGWPFAGEKAVFYNLWIIPEWIKYDHMVHFFGFGVATWVCWQILYPHVKHMRRTGVLIFCISRIGFGVHQ